MAIVEITNENFDDLTDTHSMILLDFWSPTCGPCRAFAPVYEEASQRHPDVLFGTINTEDETVLTKQFEIFSVPTLLAVKDGTIMYARPGALRPDKLEKLVSDLRDFAPPQD